MDYILDLPSPTNESSSSFPLMKGAMDALTTTNESHADMPLCEVSKYQSLGIQCELTLKGHCKRQLLSLKLESEMFMEKEIIDNTR